MIVMSNFFVPRIDKHEYSKKKAIEKKTKLPAKPQQPEDSEDDLVQVHGVVAYTSEINSMVRFDKMPAIVASEGTTKVAIMEPVKPKLKPPPPTPNRRNFRTKSAKPPKVVTKEFKDKNSNITIKIDSHPLPQIEKEEIKNPDIIKLEQSTSDRVRSAEQVIRDIRSSQGQRKIESAASDEKIDAILQQVEDHAKQWMDQKFQRPDTATTPTSPIPIMLQPASPDMDKTADQRTSSKKEENLVLDETVHNQCNVATKKPTAADRHRKRGVNSCKKTKETRFDDRTKSPVYMINSIQKFPPGCDVSEVTMSEAERDLALSLDVRNDDIIYVAGRSSQMSPIKDFRADKCEAKSRERKGMESCKTPTNIHRLCLLHDDPDILLEQQQIEATKLLHQGTPLISPMQSFQANSRADSTFSFIFDDAFPSLEALEAQKIDKNKSKKRRKRFDPSKIDPLDMEGWRGLVEKEFDDIDCSVRGHRAERSGRNQWRALMDFVPAKMMLKPHVVKAHVFPDYHGTINVLNEDLNHMNMSDSDETDEEVLKETVPKKMFNILTLIRRHKSTLGLHHPVLHITDDEMMMVGQEVKLNRSSSMPNIHIYFRDHNVKRSLARTDYDTGMAEVAKQRKAAAAVPEACRSLPNKQLMAECGNKMMQRARSSDDEDESIRKYIAEELSLSSTTSSDQSSKSDTTTTTMTSVSGEVVSEPSQEKIVQKHRTEVVHKTSKLKKVKAKTHSKKEGGARHSSGRKHLEKQRQKGAAGKKARKLLSSLAVRNLQRTQSFASALHRQNLATDPTTVKYHEFHKYYDLKPGLIRRFQSNPNLLDFKWFESRQKKRKDSEEDTREWVRDIWNEWFDELLVPVDERERHTQQQQQQIDIESEDDESVVAVNVVASKPSMPAVVAPAIVNYANVPETEDAMRAEISELTKEIEKTKSFSKSGKALHLVRRATLLRKMGQLQDALDDIKLSLQLEARLPQAYWQRHLIWLVYNDKHRAMDDLTTLLKLANKDAAAYRSLGNIFVEMNDYTMAIVNYTQAIKIVPFDANTYYQRAEIFEKTGEMLLAMDDYATVVRLDPKRTDAILKRAMFYFNEGSWPSAISSFNQLMKYPRHQALARSFRGKCNAKMDNMMLALCDLSAAIHLDPTNYENFYLRGALLRKAAPKKALQDLSVSLMLDDTEENVLALLHRGIIYTEIGHNADALADFRQILVLDHRVVCARVNIGVVMLQAYNEPKEAAKQFTIAIRSDPTYLRSYLCRADAFTRLGRYRAAANDIARAIHMEPTNHQLHLRRGKLMFDLKNYEMATHCIKHIAALSKTFESSSVTQKAIVQTFLHNYDEAIEHLQAGCKVNPSSYMNLLLAKTLMKSKQYEKAIARFRHALTLKADEDDPGRAKHLIPKKKTRSVRLQGEAHFLIGKCYQEMLRYEEAIHSYSIAMKYDSDNLRIFTERGYCRLKLEKPKGVEDLNRSISNTNSNFKAFLLRAAYYSTKQRYSKAILNCNEALKIQPKSIRTLVCRGSLKYMINAYKLAIDDLTAAIELDPNCFLAFYNRGVCYHTTESWHHATRDYSTALLLLLPYLSEDESRRSGSKLAHENIKFRLNLRSKLYINRALIYLNRKTVDYQNAALDLAKAATFNSSHLNIYFTKAVCLHRLYLLEEAIDDYDKCLDIQPTFLPAIMGRGNAYLDAQNVVAAQGEYLRALEINPNYMEARVHIGFSLQACGYYKHAWAHFTEAIKLDNKCHEAYAGRAISSLYLCNIEAAFIDIQSALAHENKSARLRTLCGVIYQCSHTLKDAMAMYKQAIEYDEEFWPAYFNAATIYLQSRRFHEAADYFNIVLEMEPQHPAGLLNRGLCNIFLNKIEEAMDDFNMSIYYERKNSHAYYNRGMLNKILKNYSAADEDFTAALEINPGDFICLKRRADVRGLMSRKEQAIDDYQKALELYESKRTFGIAN